MLEMQVFMSFSQEDFLQRKKSKMPDSGIVSLGPYVRLNFREDGLKRGRCQASHQAGLVSVEKTVPESEAWQAPLQESESP